ncbi:MAG: hypothetical protein NT075_31610 [Chloroflexi bacterium]|nr:hypothetical protein [Chloroflexota bacterium]
MPPSPYITLTPGPTTAPGKLVYYWPRYIPEGYSKHLFLNRSFADEQGYRLWLADPTAQSIIINGGLQRQGGTEQRFRVTLKSFCDFGCIPFAAGPFTGWKSGGTGAGFAYGWELDGQFYAVAGGTQYLDQVTAALEPVDLQTWLQRLAELP